MICEGSQTNVFCVLDGPWALASVRTIIDRVHNDQRGGIEIDDTGLRLVEDGADFDAPRITLTEEDGAGGTGRISSIVAASRSSAAATARRRWVK